MEDTVVPDPANQEMIDMIKKIALCAVLVLILVPAFVTAAGPQGQGSGVVQGNCQQFQQQIASQEQVANQVQLSSQMQNNGEEQRFQNRICSQECEISKLMKNNQSQVRIGSALGQGTGAGSTDQLQDQTRGRLHLQDGTGGYCLGVGAGLSSSADQLQDQTRNMTWDRTQGRLHLQDGTGGNCLSGSAGLSASADQVQDQTRDMTFDRTRGRLHLQDGTGGNCLNS